MAYFYGTENSDSIYPGYVSPGVYVEPNGNYPSDQSDTIYGYGGDDYIEGGGGGDIIDGGTGADEMSGSRSLDYYYVDNINDKIFDVGTGFTTTKWYLEYNGTDSSTTDSDVIYSSISFTLPSHIQVLGLIGASNASGTGNGYGNFVGGNSGANTLRGLDGGDWLSGGEGADILYGGAGPDDLSGDGGGDTLYGGLGNDSFHVSTGDDVDKIVELADSGVDELVVNSGTNWTLPENVENLAGNEWYKGTSVKVTGNSLNNTMNSQGYAGDVKVYYLGLGGSDALYGGMYSDSLDGGSGADYLYGEDGNDFYYVDTAGDAVIEGAGGGSDHVYATSSFTLGANIERLALVGTTAANGTGNAGANALYGNSLVNTLRGLGGADTISSGNGADVLIGGTGNDLFQYQAVIGSNPGSRDIIRAGDGAVAFQSPGGVLGDRFDLSVLDANTEAAGVQDFVFGTATGRGRLWAVNSNSNTLIRGNTDSDATVEFEVLIEDGTVLASAYTAADFLM